MALRCHKLTYTCKISSSVDFKNINSADLGCGVKSCEFASEKTHTDGTFSTSNEQAGSWNARREVFYKTLSLFTALRERGCSFRSEIHTESDSDDSTDSCDSANSTTALSPRKEKCDWKLVMTSNSYGKRAIQYVHCCLIVSSRVNFTSRCEFRRKGHSNHLRLSDIDEYDLEYLGALLDMDEMMVKRHEESALALGYGPLATCSTLAPASAKRQHCSK